MARATDPDVSRFAGRTVASWTLMHDSGFTDTDGTQPDFGRWLAEVRHAGLNPPQLIRAGSGERLTEGQSPAGRSSLKAQPRGHTGEVITRRRPAVRCPAGGEDHEGA